MRSSIPGRVMSWLLAGEQHHLLLTGRAPAQLSCTAQPAPLAASFLSFPTAEAGPPYAWYL